MKSRLFTAALTALALASCTPKQNGYFDNLPQEADPVEIGNKITNRFLEQRHSQYGSPLRVNEPRTQITYPDVCTWLGGLWFAQETNNQELTERLKARFEPLFTTEAYLQPKPNHVDNNVFGAVPLELYLQTGEERYKDLGMMYADSQWDLPEGWKLKEGETLQSNMYGDFVDADICQPEQKAWADKGYSWQTRFWLDDMYMITTIQAQAYRVTKDRKYIDRAAREMVLYLDSIQQPSGLFYHAPTAPFCWGRGNGWMAVGMSELLRMLPEDNPDRAAIMKGYLKMMEKLKDTQDENGMWKQVVDDVTMWEETSGSAMFTYAMITGVKKGWLPAEEYGPVARNGWIALAHYVNDKGDVEAVCEGTILGDNSDHYRNRKPLTGDLHGQAPVLWCAHALLTK
ncbi:glycoside hydrolase family 88 protein [Bacteroides sp. GD17]|jgi:unsaturated rhamnogalacturonyl hydrolase|uniref:glycoside hydrolase family 88/105 protein n=1 Tax=Bacteroides sp. GD17 TaxID=3139826 RepID=UPI0025DE01D5|nr:glycoside hydrolase family 88 protein [uncultured Bacteroides sp.]